MYTSIRKDSGMENFELLVAIPTYNRPTQIQNQVRSVIKQLRENVKLVVRDNYSQIPVETLFTAEELSQFTIVRNVVNIGADANIARCLETAGDCWVWTLGDDDIISDNAIDTIIQVISSHRDYCYINFASKKDIETNSFEELLNYWKIIGSFGTSFFMSACVFNMTRLKSSLRWYYEFLTSQMGQICFVIKHIEANPEEKCLFTNSRIIAVNTPGGWNPINLVSNSSLILDKFYYAKSMMKNNLFSSLCHIYLTTISESKCSIKDKLHYYRLVFSRIGWINILRYNYITLFQALSKTLLPNSLYSRLKKSASESYKKGLSK